MATGSTQPFDLSEIPVDPRGGFLTNNPDPYTDPEDVEIAGLPWGGEQCMGSGKPDDDDPTYDDHFTS